jgi:hypothetical protein
LAVANRDHRLEGVVKRKAGIDTPVPTVGEVIRDLFSQKWTKLFPEESGDAFLGNADFPGVYVIAYSNENLDGRRVHEEDIFYIGMSNHASVRSRLNRFRRVLEKGKGHAGAKRFREEWAGGTPYSRLEPKKEFLVAWALVFCETKKKRRTPKDLRKMGAVAAAEMYALARVLERTGKEPELNEQ